MIDDLVTALGDAVAQIKSDDGAPFTVVNRVFDAFDGGGAGPLAAWIVLCRDFRHLEPIRDGVHGLVLPFRANFAAADADHRLRSAVMLDASCASVAPGLRPYLSVHLGPPGDTMSTPPTRRP